MTAPTVLITGCSSGIGHATAREFRRHGWTVYATDPDRESLDDLAGLGCTIAKLDVTEDADALAVVDRIESEQGRLDFLFNNAGYGQPGPLEEVPTERLRAQFDVNVFGQHRLFRAALPLMRRQVGGTILNNSSVYGRTVFPGQGAYAASKWAVEAMSETLRTEVSAYDIDVVLLEPGPVETRFGERALAEIDGLERTGAYEWFDRLFDDRRFVDRAVGYIQPEAVADLVLDIAEVENPKRHYVAGPWRYWILAGTFAPKPVRDVVRDAAYEGMKRLG